LSILRELTKRKELTSENQPFCGTFFLRELTKRNEFTTHLWLSGTSEYL